jgi:hypothetical protein
VFLDAVVNERDVLHYEVCVGLALGLRHGPEELLCFSHEPEDGEDGAFEEGAFDDGAFEN